MIEILHRYTRAVLYLSETAVTVREAMVAAVATGADLTGAYLRGAYLTGEELTGAYLRGADLRGAYLRGAYLRGADLTGAYLRGADLTGADLTGAYLRGADLRGADLTGAYLRGAYLTSGKIHSVVGYGQLLGYEWIAYAMRDGTIRLRYGCEEMTVAEWRELGPAVARKYVPGRAGLYEATVARLLDMLESAVTPATEPVSA